MGMLFITDKAKTEKYDEACAQMTKEQPKRPSVTKDSAFKNVFSDVRKPIGVRIDTGLYKAVKPILIARYGSICRPVECFFATHLAAAADPASLSNTFIIKKMSNFV